ncbi:alpha-2,3-sialyltransferase [Campylobacter lanienae]|uniref:Alpha-2,3-sialyltransferase n=1 Tax=Campylobacter lanienae TaxID=75658 RepID=A0ABY3G8R1_9BACT|nr:alpha-2,3-sialyltransferase [Campylobacter lanienae]TWO29331.1 alpha-2,3-sialyltransferase [Campylobacter lanienae]
MTQKRLAIQFFGHTRTYKKTYESFFKHVVEPNLKDGWEIDIFIHTWDMSSSRDRSWHNGKDLFDINPLNQNDIDDIKRVYKPKKLLVEHLQEGAHGGGESKKRGNRLRESYEKENSVKYDYILYTRMDILFASPLNIQRYIDLYTKGSMKNFPLPQKHCFAAFNPFVRRPVIDIRYINEGDIVYFTNYPHDDFKPEKRLELFIIMIDYKLYRDFFLQRRDFTLGSNLALETKLKLATQNLTQKTQELQTSQDTINSLNNQLNTLNTEINSYPIKKQSLEISNLEQDLINKKLKAQILEKELGFDNEINLKYNNALQENKTLKAQLSKLNQEFETNNPKSKSENQKLQKINADLYFTLTYGTAKSRIKNQLSYKLGEAMIENSKSIWGYIRMPYVLSYIKDMHKKEQIAYNEKIKANPSLKLPPLESYPDYNEAIKIKEHLSYKLGEALINADKSKLKLGYITLWFKCKNITKEHKDNHKNSPNH